MTDNDIVHFYPPHEIFDKAAGIFEVEKQVLQLLIPDADIQHVGSCAIPGAWGKFDIDIQIRVSLENFKQTLEIMKQEYTEKHPQLWKDGLAIFLKPNSDIDIDYVVTIINSRWDDFYRTRDFLIAHPDILEKYNELKLSFEGRPYHEYRKAKGELLGSNGAVKFLEY